MKQKKIEFVARPGSGEELAGEGAGARPSAAVVRLQKEPADALQKKRGSNYNHHLRLKHYYFYTSGF